MSNHLKLELVLFQEGENRMKKLIISASVIGLILLSGCQAVVPSDGGKSAVEYVDFEKSNNTRILIDVKSKCQYVILNSGGNNAVMSPYFGGDNKVKGCKKEVEVKAGDRDVK